MHGVRLSIGEPAGEHEATSTRLVRPVMQGLRLPAGLLAKLAGTQLVLLFGSSAMFVLTTDTVVERVPLLQLAAWLAITAVLSSWAAALLMAHLLTRRMQSLTEAVDRFRDSGFTEPVRVASFSSHGDHIDQLGVAVREMSERIAQQLEMLAKTEVNRRELLANVSHDLRTPLASMQGYLETLLLKRGTISADEERGYLEVAAKHSERLGKLIRDLFQLTKLEAHEVQLRCEDFPISELVQDVVQKFQLTAGKRGVRLEARIPRQQIQVFADIGMIESVLENLVENAIRHTPAEGLIVLEVLLPSVERLTVRVVDTGRGIPSDELKSIFDRYYHVDRGEMSDIGRTGLGLAIARHVVELHGGTIAVESVLGKGTAFSFDLRVRG